MTFSPAGPDLRIERVGELAALVRQKVAPPERATLEAFVRAYYAQVDPDDLADRDLPDLYGAVLSHWGYARKRAPGQARDGWPAGVLFCITVCSPARFFRGLLRQLRCLFRRCGCG